MADNLTLAQRSYCMSRVRSKGNATTELRLAHLLRKARLKGWRRHRPLPGSPDFAWPKEKVAVFVDGCFWHGHDCGKNVSPKTNARAWKEKLERNKRRDRRVDRTLRSEGWSVVRVWECELRSSPDGAVRRIRRALGRGAKQRR